MRKTDLEVVTVIARRGIGVVVVLATGETGIAIAVVAVVEDVIAAETGIDARAIGMRVVMATGRGGEMICILVVGARDAIEIGIEIGRGADRGRGLESVPGEEGRIGMMGGAAGGTGVGVSIDCTNITATSNISP